jgi:predicted permease
VVLSHGAWQTYFGGAPDILQQHPILDGEAHQVIGVLPPGAFDRNAELWIPLAFGPDVQRRDRHWLSVSGRLRSGVTLAQAREEMAAIDTALADTMPLFKRDWTIVVEPLESVLVGDTVRHSVLLLFGAVVIVLLIACANVANLLLARGATRAKEMAVRAALGAGRGRLVVQLLTETAVLCLCGAAAGLGLAHLLLESAVPLLSDSLPYTAGVRLDGRVLGFTAIAALAVTLIVGVLPSLRASIVDVSAVLNGSARGSSSPRSALRRGIVIAEVALSLILVCAALLLFRSLHNLHGLETGVRVENIMTMSIDLPAREHPTPDSAALRYDSLVERIGAAPGVEAVALTTHLPLRWIGNGEAIQVRGVEAPMPVRFKRVDAGYFSAFDIPVVNGRGFTGRDRAGAARVVVINEALAGRLREAGIADPVGEAVLLHYPDWQNQPWQGDVQIVGVIRSERVGAPWRPDPPVVYAPLAQVPQLGVLIAVRTAGKPAPVMPAIREAVRQVAPHLPIGDVASMREIRDRTFSGISRPAWLIGAFAAMAALLAALGLYGVVAHAVAQGRREIGIRLALGATPRGVLLHVLKNAMALVAIGLSVGLAGAFAATRLMAGFLFQVSPADPLTFAAAAASLVGVGLLAGLVPASRAAGVHPDAVLRDDG